VRFIICWLLDCAGCGEDDVTATNDLLLLIVHHYYHLQNPLSPRQQTAFVCFWQNIVFLCFIIQPNIATAKERKTEQDRPTEGKNVTTSSAAPAWWPSYSIVHDIVVVVVG
jgi:hypothetical protein